MTHHGFEPLLSSEAMTGYSAMRLDCYCRYLLNDHYSSDLREKTFQKGSTYKNNGGFEPATLREERAGSNRRPSQFQIAAKPLCHWRVVEYQICSIYSLALSK